MTGITGFAGSHFADFLRRELPTLEIAGIRRYRSQNENVAHLEAAVHWIDCDLTDSASVLRAIANVQPNYVAHFAAQSYVLSSFFAPRATLDANVVGTLNLLEAMRTYAPAARLLLCSSSEVYGNVDEEHVPICESAPCEPESPYGVSKLAADKLGAVYFRAYGLPIIRTRAFTHSGPRRGAVFFDSSFCRQIALMEKGKQEKVLRVGNLDSVRTVCDVRDLVECYWKLATQGKPGEVYNVGGRETYSLRHVVEMLRPMTSVEFDVKLDEALKRPTDITNQVPNCNKALREVGWFATTPYSTTLRDCLDWWRERV